MKIGLYLFTSFLEELVGLFTALGFIKFVEAMLVNITIEFNLFN
jgi:hypothetical protein